MGRKRGPGLPGLARTSIWYQARQVTSRHVSPQSGWYGGGGGKGGGPPGRDGDWRCTSCGANVFASKTACFKCGTPKGGGAIPKVVGGSVYDPDRKARGGTGRRANNDDDEAGFGDFSKLYERRDRDRSRSPDRRRRRSRSPERRKDRSRSPDRRDRR